MCHTQKVLTTKRRRLFPHAGTLPGSLRACVRGVGALLVKGATRLDTRLVSVFY